METSHKDKDKRIILMDDNDERRMLLENCQLKARRTVNPIIDWAESDVLDYASAEKICMNPLYECGWKRVGCIGCPMAGKHRNTEFSRYPKIKAAYIRAFDRMLAKRKKRESSNDWQTGEDVMHWWIEDGVLPGQMVLEGMEEDTL
jgi:phosphoadenosine phosphosulfate reductase